MQKVKCLIPKCSNKTSALAEPFFTLSHMQRAVCTECVWCFKCQPNILPFFLKGEVAFFSQQRENKTWWLTVSNVTFPCNWSCLGCDHAQEAAEENPNDSWWYESESSHENILLLIKGVCVSRVHCRELVSLSGGLECSVQRHSSQWPLEPTIIAVALPVHWNNREILPQSVYSHTEVMSDPISWHSLRYF